LFLHAHPQAVYYNCVKFHQYRFIRLGVVALRVIWTDRRTDGEISTITGSKDVLTDYLMIYHMRYLETGL